VASARAREIANGDQPKVSGFDNKPVVLALREIEAGKTGIEILDKED
jgi:DNA-directed RNA polymerase subunit omega